MGSKQALMHLFHQMISLCSIYASKQGRIMVPFIQDFPAQEKLARHVPDELFVTVCSSTRVFSIFNISLDIVVPWLFIDLGFNIHAFFNIHAISQKTIVFYAQLSHLISLYQLKHASQAC